MEYSVEQSDGKSTLVLRGDLTIVHAAELRRVLQETIDNAKCVELDLDQVTELDLSSLQLFCSAHRTTLNNGRSISIRSAPPEVFRNSILEAGFQQTKGCKRDPGDSCLWTERT